MRPSFHASKVARTTSTFSCDIARAVSRLAVRLPMAAPAQRLPVPRTAAALGYRQGVMGLDIRRRAAPSAAPPGFVEGRPPDLLLLPRAAPRVAARVVAAPANQPAASKAGPKGH